MTESSKSYFESRPSFSSSSEVSIPVPNATRWPSQKHDASRSGQNHHAQGRRLIRGSTVETIWHAGVADPEAECAPVNIDDHFADMCAQAQVTLHDCLSEAQVTLHDCLSEAQVTLHDCLSEAQSWWTDAQEEISGSPLAPPFNMAEALDRALNNYILASFAENVRVKIDLDFLSMRATSSQIITTDKMGRLHPLLVCAPKWRDYWGDRDTCFVPEVRKHPKVFAEIRPFTVNYTEKNIAEWPELAEFSREAYYPERSMSPENIRIWLPR